jgi:glycosyltransferase involved in cell wall biosynthesis
MRSLVERTDQLRRAARVEAAEERIRTTYSWSAVTERWADFIQERVRRRAPIKVAAVTTFNSRCGIAEYSAHLYGAFGESLDLEVHGDIEVTPLDPVVEANVLRTWYNHRKGRIQEFLPALKESDAAIVHLQHNVGFFTATELEQLIAHEVPRRPLVLTLHRTVPLEVDGRIESLADIADSLRLVDAIVVHQEADRERLAAAGVKDNVRLILHGTNDLVMLDQQEARRRHGLPPRPFIIGTFGFLLPHKGVMRLLQAVSILRKRGVDAWFLGTCALHPDPSSAAHELEVRSEVKRLGLERVTRLVTDFLDPGVSLDMLSAADALVLAYEATAESASGALRSVLPLAKPTVTSRLPIFDDVAGVVEQLDAPVEPEALADVLERLWLDEAEREMIASRVRAFAEHTSWHRTARATHELYRDLLSARDA